MAMQSQALQESLLSLASSHISLTDPTYTVAAMEARAKAIVHLKSAIDVPQRDAAWSQENSATCLVFAMDVITTSDSQGWHSHMHGAKHFILGAKGAGSDDRLLRGVDCLKQTTEGRWVLRNFAYHDVLGCVTLQSLPLIEPNYIDGICSEVDSYMGVGTSLLQYIAEIQTLTVQFSQQEDQGLGNEFLADFEGKWTRIEKDLQDWACPVSTVEGSLKLIALAYRSVALILLYRLVLRQARLFMSTSQNGQQMALTHEEEDQFDPDSFTSSPDTLVALLQSKIYFHVAETVRYTSAIPVWSAPEAAVLFPLFIAGGEAHRQEQVAMVRTRLGQNLERRKFQNISRAMEVLEVVWERRGVSENKETGRQVNHPSSRSADWEDVLGEMGWELVLT